MKKLNNRIKQNSYADNTHIYGRIWGTVSLFMMILFPIAVGIIFNAWPTARLSSVLE